LELILSGKQWGLISNKYNKGIKTPEKTRIPSHFTGKKVGTVTQPKWGTTN
jgi:hypothetical protein